MTLDEAMRELQALGDPKIRQIYVRHGAGENQFGVRFGDLQKLKKKIRTDGKLAAELWATGNTDARLLATMVADPEAMSADMLGNWVDTIGYYALSDSFVHQMVARSPHARELMPRWIDRSEEYVSASGWLLLATLALNDKSLPDDFFRPFIARIEKGIHAAPNRTRHSMNEALIAIGVRSESLRPPVLETAGRIGPVHVDHGETGCKTPLAAEYIAKTLAYRAKRARA